MVQGIIDGYPPDTCTVRQIRYPLREDGTIRVYDVAEQADVGISIPRLPTCALVLIYSKRGRSKVWRRRHVVGMRLLS